MGRRIDVYRPESLIGRGVTRDGDIDKQVVRPDIAPQGGRNDEGRGRGTLRHQGRKAQNQCRYKTLCVHDVLHRVVYNVMPKDQTSRSVIREYQIK
jgi:hypothetical protein